MNLDITNIAPAPTSRVFGTLLTVLMAIMSVFCIASLIIGLGFLLFEGFHNWAINNIDTSALNEKANTEISRQTLVLASFTGAIISGAFFVIARLLKKILATLTAGDPFVSENIDRLRKIWIILALTEAFRMIASTIITLMDPAKTMNLDFDIRFMSWFLVFVIATLAEVVRRGTVIRQEQKLTI